jgi:hypothetical protein
MISEETFAPPTPAAIPSEVFIPSPNPKTKSLITLDSVI